MTEVAVAAIADGTLEQRLGRRLRALRQARGLTLKQLAATASLSHPFLSQLERGLARPSMTSLERLARALGTSRVELFASAERDDDGGSAPTIVRADEGVVGPYAEGTARLLTDGPRRFEPMEFRGSNTTAPDGFAHDEDEFLTVVEGSVVVGLDGYGEWILGPGDSVYCRSGTRHRWRSADGDPYRLIIIKELFGSRTASAGHFPNGTRTDAAAAGSRA